MSGIFNPLHGHGGLVAPSSPVNTPTNTADKWNSTELDGVRSALLASFIIIETTVLSTFSDLWDTRGLRMRNGPICRIEMHLTSLSCVWYHILLRTYLIKVDIRKDIYIHTHAFHDPKCMVSSSHLIYLIVCRNKLDILRSLIWALFLFSPSSRVEYCTVPSSKRVLVQTTTNWVTSLLVTTSFSVILSWSFPSFTSIWVPNSVFGWIPQASFNIVKHCSWQDGNGEYVQCANHSLSPAFIASLEIWDTEILLDFCWRKYGSLINSLYYDFAHVNI
jgi:hypothetical protein